MRNQTNTHTNMETFHINGNTANWANFNVKALNTKSGIVAETTEIPEALRLKVSFVSGFNPLFPSEVSDKASAFAMRHGKRRHFLLLNEGKVVGWAAFHRKERDYKVTVRLSSEDEFTVKAKSYEDALRKADAEAGEWFEGLDHEIINVELAG